MITKINKIKNFGVYKNFSGNSIPDFKTFNLIYGWNYSGKTTLSRIFRCIEKQSHHQDYKDASFELADGTKVFDQSFVNSLQIRVFNTDFIKDNLRWDENDFNPIFLLGEENIELQSKLVIGQENLIKLEQTELGIKRNRDSISTLISSALTDTARNVGAILGIRAFDKSHLTRILADIKTNTGEHLLKESNLDNVKNQAISNDEKPYIIKIDTKVTPLNNLHKQVETLLTWKNDSQKIQALLNDSKLSDWVDKGRTLHEGKNECQFCGQVLPNGLIEQINNHFSNEFDQFKSSANDLYLKIKNAEINISLPSKTAFYPSLVEDFVKVKSEFETSVKKYNAIIKLMLSDIKRKSDNPFKSIEATIIEDNSQELVEIIDNKIESIIDKNNERTVNFKAEKDKAINTIKNHFASDLANAHAYYLKLEEIKDADSKIQEIRAETIQIKEEVVKLQEQLSDTVKGAEKINSYLKSFFSKDDVHIEATSDKKFRLLRGTSIAKNLSEGEKTAIAFAYFMTTLDDKHTKLIETIVYIDDPISSLDANHLFNIFAFIKNHFYKQNGENNQKHVALCRQLFISTHNLEFHFLIADWIGKTKKDQNSFYIIERQWNKTKDESVLKEGTWLLEKQKSEYVYLFSLIYDFSLKPNEEHENYYHLPNIMRRFTETYLNFKYQSPTNIDEKIGELITDGVECERARKFMHFYSHGLSTNKFMRHADLQETEAVVISLLKAVNDHDPIHYESLVENVSK